MLKESRFVGLILCLSLLSLSLTAQYDFEHPDCKVRYSEDKDNPELTKVLLNVLKKKNFRAVPMIDNKAVIPGDTYYQFDKTLEGKLYKSCTIRSFLKVAESRLPSSKDRVLYQKQIKRSLPRVTFKGHERCKKALQETFIHIPKCKPIGFAGEKK